MVHGKYKSKSDQETQKLGAEFARELKNGDIVLLYGDLGYGKTTFVKGIARGLGITTRITSPTFVIVRSHEVKIQRAKGKSANQKSKVLYHIDLYRIENAVQFVSLGIKEILQDQDSIKLVEWPGKMAELPVQRWDIVFEMNNDSVRTIKIDKHE